MKNSEFNREIQPDILALAQDVLSAEDIDAASQLSEMLLQGKKSREHAIQHLREFVGTSPKRPVYYLNYEVGGLPGQTRHVVRYAGDYLDQMVKYCSYERGDFILSIFRGLNKSLGQNLHRLKKVFPEDLHSLLTRFNDIIYTPAKHQMDVGKRPHLFSSKEAVFVCFIVKRLAAQVAPFSKHAQYYDANGMVDYHYDRTQKD